MNTVTGIDVEYPGRGYASGLAEITLNLDHGDKPLKAEIARRAEKWRRELVYDCTREAPEERYDDEHVLVYVDAGCPIVTPRYDKTFRSPLLYSRHAFLSVCTGNRYQFDELRRAKYATMMRGSRVN